MMQVHSNAGSSTAYPQQIHRKKYREQLPAPRRNIMVDPRVCRGSTYSHVPSPPTTQSTSRTVSRSSAVSGRRSKLTSALRQAELLESSRSTTPPPITGREHFSVQTESFLEDLVDRPPENDGSTQTDPSKDRPVSPLFVPKLSGESKSTQILEGELFDFELEVEPILEILVGKALDNALMEVCEEQELKAIKRYRDAYEQKRNAAVAVTQRLEAAEIRRVEEKERRFKQERERLHKEKADVRKQTSQSIAKHYLLHLQKKIFAKLEQSGHFYDPVQREIEQQFLPWLLDTVVLKVQDIQATRQQVDELIEAAITKGFAEVREAELLRQQKEEAEKARIAAELAEQARIEAEKIAEEKRKADEAVAKAKAEEERLAREQRGSDDEEEEEEEEEDEEEADEEDD